MPPDEGIDLLGRVTGDLVCGILREQDFSAAAKTGMAKADQIKALIRSHAEGDDMRFYAIAIQVAAQAARSGHTKLAQELRSLVDQARVRTRAVGSLELVLSSLRRTKQPQKGNVSGIQAKLDRETIASIHFVLARALADTGGSHQRTTHHSLPRSRRVALSRPRGSSKRCPQNDPRAAQDPRKAAF